MASEWSRDPTEDQQRYYELLGDVCAYETNTSRGLLILHRKVGYALCGIPDEESKCDNAHTGYSENKYKTIKAVVDFIRDVNKEKTEERDQLDMAIIFVFVEYEKQVLQYPVFRILLTKSKWKFVDTNCRVYSSWQDYLKSNELPEGKFCWPLNGIYSGDDDDKVQLGWGVTPAAQPGNKAAMSWISVAGSVVGMAAGAAASRAATLARNGQVMSKTGQITCNALNVTSLAVNATGIGIGAISLRERIKEGEATALEVFQFSASLLFFAHATVNFQTASQIIKETQKGVMEDFEKSLRSNRHRKQFKKLAKNTAATGENPMDGNARVIRGIRSIDNKDDFFAGMVRTRKDFGGHKAVFSENGNIVVNGGAEIHPMKLYELGKQQRREFLSLAKQASQGKVSDATLKARFDSVLSTNTSGSSGRNTSEDSDVMEAEKILTSQLQQGTQGITIGRNEVMLMLSVVDKLTVLVCSKTDNKYAKWWHLIWHHVSKLVKEMCNTYDEALNLEKQIHNFVDKRQFDLINGIQMTNVFMHFVCEVYKKYKDHIEQLIKDIEKKLKTNDIICEKCKQAM
ncbi:uncharacterized protein LOC126485104 isoform X2 [Schistocerca serialis cubense]|uniref:uncharacterized protein LOC126485104 isoform X2 n=1 Tax=Schistocerca serialis cubense TaxID=2023355 RepID=UPI00214E37EC|nr:uncharacterized protein LOC126485104 isoform X2 [Schistocerca serialis cubense]